MTVDIEFNRVPHEKRITGQRDAASVRGTLSDNDDDMDDGGGRLSRRSSSGRLAEAVARVGRVASRGRGRDQ
jgi:hypothetical protein